MQAALKRNDPLRDIHLQLFAGQAILLMMGLMGMATASPGRIVDHGSKIILGIIATIIAARIAPEKYLRYATAFWAFCLVLLILVLLIGVGSAEGGGTRRWIDVGPIRFQPSEIAKLALVMQLSSFFARKGVQNKLISAAVTILLSTMLVILEPDLGSSILTFTLGVFMLYIAGVRISNIMGFAIALIPFGLAGTSIYLEKNPYILDRILGHQNRDQELEQGLDQIGLAHRDLSLGGLWGHGPDGPRWTYFAAHTDMIIAAIGFSGGLISVLLILMSFWMILQSTLRLRQIASNQRPMSAELQGATTLASGAMFLIVCQALVNLMVVTGMVPVTGVPLPMVSYGFSSMLTMCTCMGIIHSAVRATRQEIREI